jgi:hypothetical protein
MFFSYSKDVIKIKKPFRNMLQNGFKYDFNSFILYIHHNLDMLLQYNHKNNQKCYLKFII